MDALLSIGSFIAQLSPLHILVTVLALIVTLMGALLWVQLRNNQELHHLTYPVYDFTVKEAEKKANAILADAQEKSRAILAAAHIEAAKAIEESGKRGDQLVGEYEKRLAQLMHKHEEALAHYVHAADQSFGALASTLAAQVSASKQSIEQELKAFASNTQTTRQALEEETKRLIGEHLEKEFAAVREGLVAYRKERMRLIEQDIVSVIEQAAAIAIRKTLPLKEHAALVYEALEEAKQEGMFS